MEKVEKILCRVFGLKEDEINDDVTMESIERWDSLTHMDLITSLETELDIQFDMDEIMSMTDVKTIREIIKKKG